MSALSTQCNPRALIMISIPKKKHYGTNDLAIDLHPIDRDFARVQARADAEDLPSILTTYIKL